MPDRCVRQ